VIDRRAEGNELVIFLKGKIDSSNAKDAERRIRDAIREYPDLPWVLDAQDLEYISSAGLRVLLGLSL